MASVKLNHVYKIYPGGNKAVKDFCMSIEDKEFIVFVGPSGCGKSTTLRMIAGLEDLSGGEIYVDGRLVNDMEPKDRDIAMVFQNYALYPHISVYENMAFGLKIRKVPNEEIHRRVVEAAQILGITEYLDRKPRAMSGGQRQRVALGRAIVREPKVFLFDEPLSNLDAKLRTQMRAEIRKLHARLKTTFIYVTHDQTEAMTMGTRIVVMRDGYIQQIDTPKNLYNHPANRFVAGFIGSPQMNFYRARIDGGRVSLLGTEAAFPCPTAMLSRMRAPFRLSGQECIFGIRAEKIRLCSNSSEAVARCTVSHTEELGDETLIYGDLGQETNSLTEHGTEVVLRVNDGEADGLLPGDVVGIVFDLAGAHFFDVTTGENLCPLIPPLSELSVTVSSGTLQVGGESLSLPPAVRLLDGVYTAEIPVDAVTPGVALSAKVAEREMLDGRILTHLAIGREILFSSTDHGAVGTDCRLAVDWSRVTWMSGSRTVAAPIPEKSVLYARVIRPPRHKRGDERSDMRLALCGTELPIPPAVCRELVQTAGVGILKKRLRLEIPPDAVSVAECGIRATVKEYLDYGVKRYLVAETDGARLYVAAFAPVEGHVCLSLDLSRVTYVSDGDEVILYN